MDSVFLENPDNIPGKYGYVVFTENIGCRRIKIGKLNHLTTI